MQRRLENRNDDGLRHPENLRMVGKRYPTTMNGRQTFVDLIEGTMENDQAPLMLRLMAANIHLKTEQTNMAAEKMEFEMASADRLGNDRQPEVILVLPSNGSELGCRNGDDGTSADDDAGAEGDMDQRRDSDLELSSGDARDRDAEE